jgi:hypothetical protein
MAQAIGQSDRGRKRAPRRHSIFGRIYLVHAMDRAETWFWGISFRVTKRKSYGYASTLEEAEAAFRTEYEAWKSGAR